MRVVPLKYLRVALAGLLLVGCASSPDSPSSVLEPVTEASPVAAPVVEPPAPPKPHDRLVEQLKALGYEGFGLEFEDPSTIAFLEKVFASPQTHNLNLKHVYTGMRMQYDPVQKSLTIGGTKSLSVVLAFLKKKVPKRPAIAPIPVLKPVAKPASARPALPMAPRAMSPPPMPPPPKPTVAPETPPPMPEPPPPAPEPGPQAEPPAEVSPEPTPEPAAETENPTSNPVPQTPESSNP